METIQSNDKSTGNYASTLGAIYWKMLLGSKMQLGITAELYVGVAKRCN